jgi:hypothetical protein
MSQKLWKEVSLSNGHGGDMSELWEGIDIGVPISLRSFSLVVNSLESDATENAVRLEHEQSRIKNETQGKL